MNAAYFRTLAKGRIRPIVGLSLLVSGWLCLTGPTGCGYRFVDEIGYPGGVRRIYVTIFFNRTSQTGLENTLGREINQEFTRRDVRALAGHKAQSDAILTGEVKKVTIRAVSRRGETLTSERRITVRVSSRLLAPSGDILWEADGVTASETYFVADDKQATNDNQQAAIEKLSIRLAEKLYNQLTMAF